MPSGARPRTPRPGRSRRPPARRCGSCSRRRRAPPARSPVASGVTQRTVERYVKGTLRRPRRDLAARLERLFDAQAAVATEKQLQRIAADRLLRGPGTGVAEEAAVTEHSSWPVSTRVGDLSPAFRVIQRPGVADLGCDLRGHGGGCLRGVSPGVGVRAVFVLGSGLWVGGRRSASVRRW